MAGVRQRVGYATDRRSFMLTNHAKPARDALEGHQSCYWLGLVRDALGITAGSDATEHTLEVAVKPLVKMRDWLAARRIVLNAPSSRWRLLRLMARPRNGRSSVMRL